VLSYQPVLPQVGVALPIQEATVAADTLLPATLLPPQQLQQQQHQQQPQLKLAATENNNELATPPPTERNSALHATVPKSPPRWPLRPGVMLHVSSDTKENLAVNRMTLKPNANPNASQLSTQLSAVLNDSQTNSNSTMLTEVMVMETTATEATATTATTATTTTAAIATAAAAAANRRLMKTNPNDIALPSTDATTAEAMPELTACLGNQIAAPTVAVSTAETTIATAVVPGSMQRIWNFVFRRAKRTQDDDDGIRDSQRSHVGLLQTFWRGRGNNESPFAAQHRLKGIRCSGSGKNNINITLQLFRQ